MDNIDNTSSAGSELELQLSKLLPEHLESNSTISKLLKLYTSNQKEYLDITQDPIKLLDPDYLIEKFEQTNNISLNNVRKELFKIHLQEMFQVFEDISSSSEIYEKFKKIYEVLNIPTDNLKIVAEIDKSINSEYFNSSSSFKTLKGTHSSFFFIYDIVKNLNIGSVEVGDFFTLKETLNGEEVPYEYTVETSMYEEVFKETVVPLAHPVGFNYTFYRLVSLILEDYFGLDIHPTLTSAILTCINDHDLPQLDVINSGYYGEYKSFLEEKIYGKIRFTIDYYSKDGKHEDGYRLVRDVDNSIVIYDRQREKTVLDDNNQSHKEYLDIDKVKLKYENEGILEVLNINRYYPTQYVALYNLKYKKYTISDNKILALSFTIHDGNDENEAPVWYNSYIDISNLQISSDPSFYETLELNTEDILNGCVNYNGKVVKRLESSCSINYKAEYKYTTLTLDNSEYVVGVRGTRDSVNYTLENTQKSYINRDRMGCLSIDNIVPELIGLKCKKLKKIGDGVKIGSTTQGSSWKINEETIGRTDSGYKEYAPGVGYGPVFSIPSIDESLNLIGVDPTDFNINKFIRHNTKLSQQAISSGFIGKLPFNYGINWFPGNAQEAENLRDELEKLIRDNNKIVPKLYHNGDGLVWEYDNTELTFSITAKDNDGLDLTGDTPVVGDGTVIGTTGVYVGSTSIDLHINGIETYWKNAPGYFNTNSDKDDFSFGVYKYNSDTDEWELLEDNNIGAYQ